MIYPKRRFYMKLGILSLLPLPLIAKGKKTIYPIIRYEKDYSPYLLTWSHKVHITTNGQQHIITEWSDEEIIPDKQFMKMVENLYKEIE